MVCGQDASRVEAAALVDVCKVDADVGLHAGCGDLQHPGGRIQALCQARHPINSLHGMDPS